MDAFIIMKTKYLAQQNFNILRILDRLLGT